MTAPASPEAETVGREVAEELARELAQQIHDEHERYHYGSVGWEECDQPSCKGGRAALCNYRRSVPARTET